MAINGTINANVMDVRSINIPIMGGIRAPPTIAVTIKPDNSLVRSGILSTVIEKINGKILANPKPTKIMLIKVTTFIFRKISNIPITDMRTVISRNFLGFNQRRIIPPVNLPIRIGKKNNAQAIHNPNSSRPKLRLSKTGTSVLKHTSAPT